MPVTPPARPHGKNEPSGLQRAVEAAVLAHARPDEEVAGDPGGFLRLTGASTEALRVCEGLQTESVHNARRAGHSWAELGGLIGISRQAAQQRFAPETVPQDGPNGVRRITWATAFNEMQILKSVGAAGYHLTGVGAMSMEVDASPDAWEHRREAVLDDDEQAALAAEGWTYVGRWFPFHYFKRKLGRKAGAAGPGNAGFELFPKDWTASYGGHEIRVRNSWNGGLKLFVDETLLAEHRGTFALEKNKPVLNVIIEPDLGKPFSVEVFAYALLTVKVKIVVNGEQIAGDAF